jgi:hypothetical protein
MLVIMEGVDRRAKTRARRVWVPAFAGTTDEAVADAARNIITAAYAFTSAR